VAVCATLCVWCVLVGGLCLCGGRRRLVGRRAPLQFVRVAVTCGSVRAGAAVNVPILVQVATSFPPLLSTLTFGVSLFPPPPEFWLHFWLGEYLGGGGAGRGFVFKIWGFA